jgi:ABC-type amino acid transport substrate-binding protein
MVRQESEDEMRLLNVQIMLTPQQVASEIVQAVTEGRRDLTLAPNPDIAFALQLFAADQDKAEDVMGQSMQRQLANLTSQSS